MMDLKEVETKAKNEVQRLDVAAEKAKQKELKVVNATDSWIERHPNAVLAISLLALAVMMWLVAHRH